MSSMYGLIAFFSLLRLLFSSFSADSILISSLFALLDSSTRSFSLVFALSILVFVSFALEAALDTFDSIASFDFESAAFFESISFTSSSILSRL